MNRTEQEVMQTSEEMLPKGHVKSFCPREFAAVQSAPCLSVDNDECNGFDPYDTASLFVLKS